MNHDLKTFADGLLKTKGIHSNDEKVLDQMRSDLISRIENRIHAVIASNMPEDSRQEFEKMVDSNASDEDVSNYCGEKIPNLPMLISDELTHFQAVYLGNK